MAINVTAASALANVGSIISALTPFGRLDIISISAQDTFQQLFLNAQPLRASVHESARVMDYPVESGAVYSDHRIINPTNIEIVFLINSQDYSSTYQEIRNAFINSTGLAVQTRTGIYQNMIIQAMPHEEDPDKFDAIQLVMSLREVKLVLPSTSNQPNNYQPLDPTNASTVPRGLQFSSDLLSTAFSVSSYIRAASVWGISF